MPTAQSTSIQSICMISPSIHCICTSPPPQNKTSISRPNNRRSFAAVIPSRSGNEAIHCPPPAILTHAQGAILRRQGPPANHSLPPCLKPLGASLLALAVPVLAHPALFFAARFAGRSQFASFFYSFDGDLQVAARARVYSSAYSRGEPLVKRSSLLCAHTCRPFCRLSFSS